MQSQNTGWAFTLETVNDVTVGQCLIVYFNSWEYQNWLNKTASNGIPAEMSSKCNVGCVDGSACQELCLYISRSGQMMILAMQLINVC